jgi:4-hydroxythreonine-4-phosphate dehydrogenase
VTRKIGVTLGDPAGIGPEIVARALAAAPRSVRERCVIYGDAAGATPGRPTPEGAAATIASLEAAVAAARAGDIAALVTAPISKAQVKAAGFAFPGHTEFLADRLGAAEHAMMFVGPTLRVVLATIHLPLGEVARRLGPADVARAVFLGGQALVRSFDVPAPRIGVLGLNPHAGEGGLFGDEEARVVTPGIAAGRDRLAAAGITAKIDGPLVPDAAYRAPYDLFVALYHDQGLIPVKLVDFDLAVNVTLGLPIVRTSPDHGVAYDIAGTGRARPESFAAALGLAARMIR